MFISSTERAQISAEYPKVWNNISDVRNALVFLSKITDADCCQTLELDADQRSGLSATLKIITEQLSKNLYDGLPCPDEFAVLCNGNGGQADE